MWLKGKRRNTSDVTSFVTALVKEFGSRGLARRCKVSDRTIRRWANGEDWPSLQNLYTLVESICDEPSGVLPLYSTNMAIDGNTRVGGVGEYSRRAAKGDQEYLIRKVVDND